MSKFKELNLNNAFLFAATAQDPEACQIILEIILGREIPPVKVHTEHTVLISSDYRSIRLDVYGTDVVDVNYNVEAQNKNYGNLPKRSRYHQAEMDISSLKPGEDFNELKPSYVIFICTFDPFGKGLYRYTFENWCTECEIALGDETMKIFLNTKGKNDSEVSEELIHFLKYLENSTDDYVAGVKEERIRKLHGKVADVKRNSIMEEKFMTGEEMLRISKKEGKREAKIEDIFEFLAEHGEIPEPLKERILAEENLENLTRWVKLAAKATSIEEFAKSC